MQEILHKRRRDLGRGTKLITINSRIEDSESKTRVRKSFLYHVMKTGMGPVSSCQPEIHIRKTVDTKNKIEKFSCQIKGYFYTTNGDLTAKVYFHHCLNVRISWIR